MKTCSSRYGKLVDNRKGHAEYIKNNTRIICKFSPEGICYAITFMHAKSSNNLEKKLEVNPIVIINSWSIKGLQGGNGQFTNGKIIVNYDAYFVSAYDMEYLRIRK